MFSMLSRALQLLPAGSFLSLPQILISHTSDLNPFAPDSHRPVAAKDVFELLQV